MITIRQLRYLEALDRTGHFGRAAGECAVTQPALSQQVQELEKHLGLTLVERQRGAIRLTPEGTRVVDHARTILGEIRAIEGIATADRGLTGEVRIGMIPTIAPYLLPQLLPQIKERFPDARLNVRESQTENLVREASDGRIDLIVAALPLDNTALEVVPLFDDTFLLASSMTGLAPPSSDLAGYIADQQLLLLEEGHCLRDQALRHCDAAGIRHGRIFGTSNLATVIQMAANGLGVTLVPELCLWLEASRSDVRLSRFGEPQPFRTVALAWRKASPLTRQYRKLGEMVARLGKQTTRLTDA